MNLVVFFISIIVTINAFSNIDKKNTTIFLKTKLEYDFIKEEAISQALADIIDLYFIKEQIYFNITILTAIEGNYSNTIGKTLQKIKGISPTKVNTIKLKEPLKKNIIYTNSSTVFFVEPSVDENVRLINFIKTFTADPKKLKFLIYKKTCKIYGLTPISTNRHVQLDALSLYSYFLCHRSKSFLKFVTYEYFGEEHCYKMKRNLLNTFSLKTMTWLKEFKGHRKFRNYHKCEIKIRETNVYRENVKDGKQEFAYEKFWQQVAKTANFTLTLTKDSDRNAILRVKDGHLTLSERNISVTSVFSSLNIGLMVTRGEAYNDYEKLLLPFDLTTWILLLITFGFGFFVIFIINQMSIKIQEKVYGRNIKTPSLNIISTFFGIAQLKLPKTNFARFILVMFIMFCLIIRTAYQGVIFDFMNSDMRKPHATTIEEVFEKNYKVLSSTSHVGIIFHQSISDFNQEWIEKIDQFAINNNTDRKTIADICKYILKDEPNTAIVTHELLDLFLSLQCNVKPIRVKNTIFTIPQGFGMPHNHYLYFVTEDLIKPMFESGILNHMYSYWIWSQSSKTFQDIDWPKVLSLSDLSYGFNIWLITCGFAIIVFFMEIITWKIENKNKGTNDIEMKGTKEVIFNSSDDIVTNKDKIEYETSFNDSSDVIVDEVLETTFIESSINQELIKNNQNENLEIKETMIRIAVEDSETSTVNIELVEITKKSNACDKSEIETNFDEKPTIQNKDDKDVLNVDVNKGILFIKTVIQKQQKEKEKEQEIEIIDLESNYFENLNKE
ncbi:hypothetical protein PVAND_015178 [Polypedilum vanderplanki]|uniref:Ionotropic receptor n=1 Tax=Polypedilum vanderplanki TaxID=319348 RepID=A0A9J6BBZ9_POLVA|nr:hypothetical protein PVAND_015178 [Polypedilum vanderplanki]